MLFLFLLAFCSILAGPALGDEGRFIERWKSYDEHVQVFDQGPRYQKMIPRTFDSLPDYDGRIEVPAGVAPDIERVLLLYAQQNMTILLVTPKNSMKDLRVLNEEYRLARAKCGEDKAWLVLLPENAWTPVELNPYCSMDYGEDSIKFDLFWAGSAKPLIDIVTSGLTCTPHYLYGWDGRYDRYDQKADKCTGQRTVEGYAESGSQLQQLF